MPGKIQIQAAMNRRLKNEAPEHDMVTIQGAHAQYERRCSSVATSKLKMDAFTEQYNLCIVSKAG